MPAIKSAGCELSLYFCVWKRVQPYYYDWFYDDRKKKCSNFSKVFYFWEICLWRSTFVGFVLYSCEEWVGIKEIRQKEKRRLYKKANKQVKAKMQNMAFVYLFHQCLGKTMRLKRNRIFFNWNFAVEVV